MYRGSDVNTSVEHRIASKNIIKKNTTRRTNKSAIVTYERSRLILLTNSGNVIKHANGSSKEENGRGTSKLPQAVSTPL
jgi:hypothetical protein